PRQTEAAAIERRLNARWANIKSILPEASKDTILEQVNVIACICADRVPLWERVKLFDAAAAAIYKAAAALAQAGADQQQCSVLKKIGDEARQSAYDRGSSSGSRRQRERAAKEAAALAALRMLEQAYPKKIFTAALRGPLVELSENLFEVATGRKAT